MGYVRDFAGKSIQKSVEKLRDKAGIYEAGRRSWGDRVSLEVAGSVTSVVYRPKTPRRLASRLLGSMSLEPPRTLVTDRAVKVEQDPENAAVRGTGNSIALNYNPVPLDQVSMPTYDVATRHTATRELVESAVVLNLVSLATRNCSPAPNHVDTGC